MKQAVKNNIENCIENKAKNRRISDIDPNRLMQLNQGLIETQVLIDGLAMDFVQLFQASFPDLALLHLKTVQENNHLGITKRMAFMGELLFKTMNWKDLARAQSHASDTVRGWACYMIGANSLLSFEERLRYMIPLADDAHFGVREWAWLAMRPHVSAHLNEALLQLEPLTKHSSENLRRFACEVTRPRGVWCLHLAALKVQPELALPILENLRSDSVVYVQDSVANWLNDASKTRADWVQKLCEKWLMENQTSQTHRIVRRALRTLKRN